MTKLMEWLSGAGVLFAVWFYLITNKPNNFVREQYDLILYSPIIFVLLFGLYAASVVLYRVYTFNDCEKAAAELQEEIKEAKEELSRLGFKFQSN
ncbi:dolichol-phosphate mannosyltransferase subunit 3 [Diabrotica virgifera virgifera]|uniref:Dolichol-phosphate mannosyltransferase subunit 3 n=1 Tax=Diabrotica virgifera virgifera TaxID=50390 RepID=A0A6P7GDA4_DIAVI|nr:dolichol-phosphate mannosyltransferase subunit 3 [Diabrotica virgifera virgifera]